MTARELFDKASIPTSTTGRSALKELFSAGQIERTGKGFPGNPFRYLPYRLQSIRSNSPKAASGTIKRFRRF